MKKSILLGLVFALMTLMSCKKDDVKQVVSNGVYKVTASQSGTSAPSITEHVNTLGGVQWEYVSVGVYHGKLPGAFVDGKTFVLCNNGVNGYISSDVRSWDADFIELRTFAGIDSNGHPIPSNGCGDITFEVTVYQ